MSTRQLWSARPAEADSPSWPPAKLGRVPTRCSNQPSPLAARFPAVRPDSRPLTLILNPAASAGGSSSVLSETTDLLSGAGAIFRTASSDSPEHLAELARSAADAGEMPVAVGGDGTFACIARELAGSGVPVGLVPAGRGNDFARVAGIPTDAPGAVDTLLNGRNAQIDLGEANGVPFVGIASFGFDSDANRIANETRLFKGSLVYLFAALKALLSWKPATFEISTPDEPARCFTGWTVAIANNRAYGGGMFIAPDADLQDSEFDVVTVAGTRKIKFVGSMPKIFKGTHVREPDVDVMRAAEIEVRADRPFDVYADGDLLTSLPVKARVLPGALLVRIPLLGSPLR